MVLDTPNRVRRLARQLEPTMRRAFLDAIESMVASVAFGDLEDALRAGNVDLVIATLNINDDHFGGLREALRTTFVAGGGAAIGTIPPGQRNPRGIRVNITFSGDRPNEAAIVRAIGDPLIVEINDAIELAIRETVADATFRSQNPRRTALDIVGRVNPATGRREGGILGNTSKDAETIRSVGRGVLDGDKERLQSYLTLKSRNKRHDGQVKRIIAGTEVGTRELADSITTGMSNNLLFARGQRIARTNTLGAFGEGRDAGYQRIIDEGIVADTVTKTWSATGDGVTRSSHLNVDGTTVPFDQPFVVNGSLLMRPRDRSLGAAAEEIINCRCISVVEIDYLDPRNL